MSIVDDLARIREAQGKEPLPNPHIISGFGPEDPPVPPYYPMERHETPQNPPEDPLQDEFLDAGPPPEPMPPSPLIPRAPRSRLVEGPIGTPAIPATIKVPDLVVLGNLGAWRGREVQLTDADEREVRKVVLKAIQREVTADLALAGVKRVRRVRATPEAAVVAPAKRGRPRRVKP